MKRYAKYIEWAWMIVMLLVPCIGFADSTDLLKGLNFTPPAGDLSVAYLAKIFGAIPGIKQFPSDAKTILGPIFYIFNAGVLGISGLFLGYTTFKLITETATDGASMAKASTMWVAVRTSLSAGLLVPTVSGYSVINSIVMWVVIQSVGLADSAWTAAINYLSQGAPITVQTKNLGVDYSLIGYGVTNPTNPTDVNNKADESGATDVLSALVCSHTIKNALNKKLDSKGKYLNSEDFKIYVNKPYVLNNPNTGYYAFPYVPDANKLIDSNYYGLSIDSGIQISGICGYIQYATPGSYHGGPVGGALKVMSGAPTETGSSFGIESAYTPKKAEGLQRMIDILDPVAQDIVKQSKPQDQGSAVERLDVATYVVGQINDKPVHFCADSDYSKAAGCINKQYLKFYSDPSDDHSPINEEALKGINPWPLGAKGLLEAALGYGIILNSVDATEAKKSAESVKLNYERAKARGWILAGGYYVLLEQAEEILSDKNKKYRLTVYDESKKIDFAINRLAPTGDPFFIIGSSNTAGKLPAIERLLVALDPNNGTNPSSNSDIQSLTRALEWISYIGQYAKLYGLSLYPALYPVNKQNISDVLSLRKAGIEPLSEAVLNARLYSGSVLMAVPILALAGMAILRTLPLEYLIFDVDMVMNKWNWVMSKDSVSDPIVKLQKLGQQMVISAFSYVKHIQGFVVANIITYTVSSLIISAMTFVVGSGSFWGVTTGTAIGLQTLSQIANSLQEIPRVIAMMYLPIGLAIVTPMCITGVILSVYVPLIPYLLFLMGVMSWFISVIVLMAAAPIICFLMLWGAASQENPLLSREAEQFIQQIISVFFRPILMVIGLVIGVILARIGVDVLNAGFVATYDIIFPAGDNADNPTIVMFQQLGGMVIYTFVMVSLVNLCFSTIYMLHSEVMGVVGVRVMGAGMEEKALGEAKQASQGFATETASYKDQAVSGKEAGAKSVDMRKEGKAFDKHMKDKKDQEKSKQTTVT